MSYLDRVFENKDEVVVIPNAVTFNGPIVFGAAVNMAGATLTGLTLTASVVAPDADDGAALGSTALKWSDLFLASGAVINFNSGDVTITHSANALAFAGASSGYSFDAVILPATTDGAALGSGTVMWSDLFLASGAVINFNNGDVTITHSANTLAFAGASSGYSFAGPVSVAGNLTFAAATTRAINFDGITPPADAGNYGQTLDCGWLAIDPGSGGSFGAKLMFSNVDTSGYILYGLGLRCRTAAAGAIAVGFNVSASAAVAASGQVIGGQFYLQNSGSYTIEGVYESTALYCKSWLAAACGPSASALWIDDESSVKATAQYMVDITMNGSVEIDKVFHIYGGDPGADTFIDFDTCDQGAGAFVSTDTTDGADLTSTHKIKCTVNGSTVGYLHLFSA